MSTLYYIRGSKTNPEGVKQILLDRGGILETRFSFNDEDGLYYIGSNSKIEYTIDDSNNPIRKLLLEYGTKLQPTEPKEILEPFDRVLGRCGEGKWGIDIFMAITYDKYMECIGATYTECHKYESWMDKYVYTDVSFEEFKKD